MDPQFERFIDYLKNHEDACKVAARLQGEGVNLLRVFRELTVYIQGRSIAAERTKRGNEFRKILNQGVRKGGVAPEVGRWLQARSELAFSTKSLSKVRNVDSLAGAHIYMELKTKRRVSANELAYLVEAANYGLGRRSVYIEPNSIAIELRRHKQKNATFLKILREDIASKLL